MMTSSVGRAFPININQTPWCVLSYDVVFIEVIFQVAGCVVLAFLHIKYMTVKDDNMSLPVVLHIVAMDGKTRTFTAAAGAKEPGGILGEFGIQGIPCKTQFPFCNQGMTVSPDLQGAGVYLGGICGNGEPLTSNADIAGQRIEAGFFIVAAVVGTGHRFIFAFCHIGIDGVSTARAACRAEGEHTDQNSQHEQRDAYTVHMIHSLSDCLLLFYRKIVCLAKFVQIGYTDKRGKAEVTRR